MKPSLTLLDLTYRKCGHFSIFNCQQDNDEVVLRYWSKLELYLQTYWAVEELS